MRETIFLVKLHFGEKNKLNLILTCLYLLFISFINMTRTTDIDKDIFSQT